MLMDVAATSMAVAFVYVNAIRVKAQGKQKQNEKQMKVSTLKKVSLDNLLRLAKYLGLHIRDGMSKGQIARLIKWRTSLHRDDNLVYWLNRNKKQLTITEK
jgi:hypothetical protein